MPNKDTLKSMLSNIIKDNQAEAQVDFHRYLKDKMHSAYTNGATTAKETSATSVPATSANDTE